MDERDLTVTIQEDRPKGGAWHCGPNPCWVTVKHHPTSIMARAYHRNQHKAREIALACVALMLEDCDVAEIKFPKFAP